MGFGNRLLRKSLKRLKFLSTILGLTAFFGVVLGWLLHLYAFRDYQDPNCLLTKNQVADVMKAKGYTSGPFSVCLDLEEGLR